MSLIRKLEYNPETECVICSTKSKLSRCKIFNKIWKRLYPNEYLVDLIGYTSSLKAEIDSQYIHSQDIFLLNEKHINVINTTGIDAYIDIKFSIFPKEMLFYIANNSGYITTNFDRYLLKKFLDSNNCTISDYLKMKNEAYLAMLKNNPIKNILNDSNDSSEEDMGFK